MLKYLVVQLADDVASYCHYENISKGEQFISVDNLKAAIRFGMVENLNIQFVYPKRALPDGYAEIIETIDHTKIMPCGAPHTDDAHIVVCNSVAEAESCKFSEEQIVILRICRKDIGELPRMFDILNGKCARVNIVITDIDKFADCEFEAYKATLTQLGNRVKAKILGGSNTQLNLLTDRLVLKAMNNCNAGDEVVTLMPNGKFYPCAGFYYDDAEEDFGDLTQGVQIKKYRIVNFFQTPCN